MRKPRLFTSANSAATKKALAASRNSASSRLRMVAVIGRGRRLMPDSFSARKARTSRRSTSRRDEGLADAAHQDEGELAALDLLVLRDQVHQRIGVGLHRRARRDMRSAGRPRQGGATRALRRRPAQQAEPRRELEGQRHAERDRLAVQQPVGEAGRGLERMAEGVAEIEQRAVAGLALVARRRSRPCRGSAIAIACSRAGPPANTSCQLASSQAKKSASPSRPYFATSA